MPCGQYQILFYHLADACEKFQINNHRWIAKQTWRKKRKQINRKIFESSLEYSKFAYSRRSQKFKFTWRKCCHANSNIRIHEKQIVCCQSIGFCFSLMGVSILLLYSRITTKINSVFEKTCLFRYQILQMIKKNIEKSSISSASLCEYFKTISKIENSSKKVCFDMKSNDI